MTEPSRNRHLPLTLALVLVALGVATAAAAGAWVSGWPGGRLTGDEPHYLLTAISLAEDRDLDLSDEFAGNRYRPFHERPLRPQGRKLADGRVVSPHEPSLPALLALPAAAGGWLAARLVLAALAGALAAMLVWTAVVRFAVPATAASLVTLVFGMSAPLAVYGSQVYPELPAALLVAIAAAALTGPFEPRGRLVFGAALVALLWLGVKYAPVAGAFAALGLFRSWRSGRHAATVALAGGLGLGAVALAAANRAWYGGWTPYAANRRFASGELDVIGSDADLFGRASRLLSLLVDREFGLAAWQPAWLLAIPAVVLLARLRPRGWSVLIVPLAAGWLTATIAAPTIRGWWPPGRHVVAVLPLAVLAVARWARSSRFRLAAVVVAGVLGVVTYAWVVVEGSLGELTWVVGLSETSSPLYRAWQPGLPNYGDVTPTAWALHSLWLAAVLVASLALAVRPYGRSR